jgi:CO/xanthine dehydrogenase FAD-binding subunit
MGFDVISPANIDEALYYLDKFKQLIHPIAGGTNMLVDVKRQKVKPHKLLDLTKLDELKKIESNGSKITIGSLVTHTQLHCHPLFKSFPLQMLSQAAAMVGAPAIRNRGTVGGNIQSASPAADVVVPLLALDAKLVLASIGGKREIYLKDFLLGPGKTDRKPEELITEIRFDCLEDDRSVFYKLGQRNALAIAIVSLALQISFSSQNEVTKVAIALGSVAPTAVRARNTEDYLLGKTLTDETIRMAREMLTKDIKPISDLRASSEYRDSASQVLLARALKSVMPNSNTSCRGAV